MGALKDRMIADLTFAETDLEQPVFTWMGEEYFCLPSITTFNRNLGEGGFQNGKLLTLTVRLINDDEHHTFVFGANLPEPQQIIIYKGENFRIESVKKDPTGSH